MRILNLQADYYNKDFTGVYKKFEEAILSWIAKSKLVQVNDEILCAESFAYTAKMSVRPNFDGLIIVF